MGLHYLRDVVSLAIDESHCTGCSLCIDVCPRAVLAIEHKKVRVADRDACIECGACQQNCPFQAISVTAGVGCANAIIRGAIKGTEPNCGCAENGSRCS